MTELLKWQGWLQGSIWNSTQRKGGLEEDMRTVQAPAVFAWEELSFTELAWPQADPVN